MKNKLPDFILADLYKSSIVLVEEDIIQNNVKNPLSEGNKIETSKNEIIPDSPIKNWYLGDNKKNIVILVKDTRKEFLNDASLKLLTGILSACQLQIADVSIINISKTPMSYKQIGEKLNPRYLLFFGINPEEIQLQFSLSLYHLYKENNCSFLLSADLNSMLGNTNEARVEKSKLWLCLKEIRFEA